MSLHWTITNKRIVRNKNTKLKKNHKVKFKNKILSKKRLFKRKGPILFLIHRIHLMSNSSHQHRFSNNINKMKKQLQNTQMRLKIKKQKNKIKAIKEASEFRKRGLQMPQISLMNAIPSWVHRMLLTLSMEITTR